MSYLANWDKELQELDDFMAEHHMPNGVEINPWTKIDNGQRWMTMNLETARANNGEPTYRPYLDRAIQFMEWVRNN